MTAIAKGRRYARAEPHRNPAAQQEVAPGRWMEGCPLPWERGLFRLRYGCACGLRFRSQEEYRLHWREMNWREGGMGG